MTQSVLTIFTDGGARGNPGPAGIGVWMQNQQTGETYEIAEYIGETTNNQAEYRALVRALEKAHELGAQEVQCFLDSELIVKQLNREYRVKDKNLAVHFLRAWNLAALFKKISFQHVPRAQNKQADALVNRAIDSYLQGA